MQHRRGFKWRSDCCCARQLLNCTQRRVGASEKDSMRLAEKMRGQRGQDSRNNAGLARETTDAWIADLACGPRMTKPPLFGPLVTRHERLRTIPCPRDPRARQSAWLSKYLEGSINQVRRVYRFVRSIRTEPRSEGISIRRPRLGQLCAAMPLRVVRPPLRQVKQVISPTLPRLPRYSRHWRGGWIAL